MNDRELIRMYRRENPTTSKSAAQLAALSTWKRYAAIVTALREHGAMTSYGISRTAKIPNQEVTRRLPELRAMGFATPTGRTMDSPLGSPCRVWQATSRVAK